MPRPCLSLAAALVAVLATAAHADDGDRKLRLIGRSSAPAPGGFVIDAVISKGYEPLQSSVSGWFSALSPDTAADDISGTCIEDRCVLTVSLDEGKLSLTGDFAKAGATTFQGRAIVSESYGDAPKGEAPATFTVFDQDIPGVGRLAADGAVTARELANLAVWAGASYGFNYTGDHAPEDMERSALGEWQALHQRPVRGLILEADLAALKAEAAAARARAKWTPVAGKGWTAGYPASMLSPAGGGRYAAPDGKSSLAIAVDPPVDEAGWDALVDKAREEIPGREINGYTRVNDDYEVRYLSGGVQTFVIYHRRKGGVARLEMSWPAEAETGLVEFESILPREFVVDDEIAPEPR
jgi:hypothetical protein